MLLISLSLALLVIIAGMNLLAKNAKENLGSIYKYISYFVIVVGFLSIICIGARCMMRCCNSNHGRCGTSQPCEEEREYGYRKHCMSGEEKGGCDEMDVEKRCLRMRKMHCCGKMMGNDSTMGKNKMECDEEIGFTHKCHSNEVEKEK